MLKRFILFWHNFFHPSISPEGEYLIQRAISRQNEIERRVRLMELEVNLIRIDSHG